MREEKLKLKCVTQYSMTNWINWITKRREMPCAHVNDVEPWDMEKAVRGYT